MTREKFQTRTIRLVGEQQLSTALALLPNLPLDAKNPLEIVIREEVKARKLDQNGAMWAGTLKDIEQLYLYARFITAESMAFIQWGAMNSNRCTGTANCACLKSYKIN